MVTFEPVLFRNVALLKSTVIFITEIRVESLYYIYTFDLIYIVNLYIDKKISIIGKIVFNKLLSSSQ